MKKKITDNYIIFWSLIFIVLKLTINGQGVIWKHFNLFFTDNSLSPLLSQNAVPSMSRTRLSQIIQAFFASTLLHTCTYANIIL